MLFRSAVSSANILDGSIVLSVSDTSSFAEVTLQGSNDNPLVPGNPLNWTDIPSTAETVTNGNGLQIIPSTKLCYEYIRVAYSTLGTGSVTAKLKILGE